MLWTVGTVTTVCESLYFFLTCCLSLRFSFGLVPLGVVSFCQNCDILATSSALYMFNKVLLLDRLVHAIVCKWVAHLFVASLFRAPAAAYNVGLFSPVFSKQLYRLMPTFSQLPLFDYCCPISWLLIVIGIGYRFSLVESFPNL